MRSDIQQEVLAQLSQDYGLKNKGTWHQQGQCPQCHKKELYVRTEAPWTVRCGRENKCGWQAETKTLYPHCFEQFSQRYPATASNPNATAEAYLQYARGLPPELTRGHHVQSTFWHTDADKGTDTVRFYLDRPNNIYMERFIDPVQLRTESKPRQAHFNGARKGLWWQPAGQTIAAGDQVWWVEGCIDALSLHAVGIKAVATLSANNYPAQSLEPHLTKGVEWVIALDNDQAGNRYTKKWMQRLRETNQRYAVAKIPASGKQQPDWNDQYRANKLGTNDLQEYRYQGDLFIASKPLDKACLIWNHDKSNAFAFTFQNQLYWFAVDLDKYAQACEALYEADKGLTDAQIQAEAAETAGMITSICNCIPTFLYYQAHPVLDESWYYTQIQFPDGKIYKNTFSGGQLASSTEFKKRLISIAPGGLYSGGGKQLNWLIKHYMQDIQTVETIEYIGYSKQHGLYVYPNLAVQQGQVLTPNAHDFFESDRLSIKTLHKSYNLVHGAQADYTPEWLTHYYTAFGNKGLVALTFWIGSLFAEQIRGLYQSYPFLEIVGEPGGGKSTLLEFLWKLTGRPDEEGFDPNKGTFSFLSRQFNEVSNLPVVLIESDRDEKNTKAKKFDWETLKTAYNGRSHSGRGLKTNDNATYSPLFKGTIIISQNAPVDATQAILERLVHINLDKSHHTPQTYAAAKQLNLYTVNQLSYFLIKILVQEQAILQVVRNKCAEYEEELIDHPKIRHVRVAKNHAQLLALAEAIQPVLGLDHTQFSGLQSELIQMAQDRQVALQQDHPVVQNVFEIVDYLDSDPTNPQVNHSRNPQIIAINLNHFIQIATEHKQPVPSLIEMKQHLKTGKAHPFIGIKATNSALTQGGLLASGKTVKCWQFAKQSSGGKA